MMTSGDIFYRRLIPAGRAAAFAGKGLIRAAAWRGLALALAAAAAGCGGNGAEVAPPQPAALLDFVPTAEFETLWADGVGGGGDFYLVPAVADGAADGDDTAIGDGAADGDGAAVSDEAAIGDGAKVSDGVVCAAGGGGELRRWRIADGAQLAQARAAGGAVAAAVGCDEEFFAVADAQSVLRVVGADGAELWSRQLTGAVAGAPLIAQARLFVLSGDGGVSAYPLRRGEALWRWRGGEAPPLRIRADSRPVFADGVIYAGLSEGRIVALRADSGAQLWSETLAEPGGDNPIAAIVEVTTPVVVGETVCAGAYQGRIGCMVRAGGQTLWRRDFSSLHRIAADQTRLFARDDDGVLSAFDAAAGDLLWTQEALKYRGGGAPAALDGFVVAGDSEGFLHAFAAADGAPAARVLLDGSAVIALLAVGDNRLVAQTAAGGVFGFSLR